MVSLRNAAIAALFYASASASKPNKPPKPPKCPEEPTRLVLSDPPYTNYFYSDCNTAAQVIVTSPLPDSDLTIIGPRLLVSAKLVCHSWR